MKVKYFFLITALKAFFFNKWLHPWKKTYIHRLKFYLFLIFLIERKMFYNNLIKKQQHSYRTNNM